ncbi:MAG: response regulator [Desulfobacteraceae bacterium]|nr:response regulator [Desulfobacteraceae bacterium]
MKNKKKPRGLAFHIYTGIAGVLLLIGIVFGIAFYIIEKQRYETLVRIVEVGVDSIVNQYESAIANELFIKHTEVLGLITREMLETEDVIGVAVFSENGNLIIESGEITIRNSPISCPNPENSYNIEQGELNGLSVLIYTKPIVIIDEQMGYIRVYYTLDKIRRKEQKAGALFFLLFFALLFSLFFLIKYLLNYLVISPVTELRKGMEAIHSGELGKQAQISANNEIGTLARAFNDMSEKNARMYQELIDLNVSLEKKVKQRTAQLEKADKAKSEFLANMSHEIRTPMNAILGFSEILLSESCDTDQTYYLEIIRSSGQTLLSLINDILDLSKIEAGRVELRKGPVDMKILLWEMKQMFMPASEKKGIRLETEVNPEIPGILITDELRLRQILINLLGNAVKFTSKGYVKLSARGEFADSAENRFRLFISVEDTGTGIREDQQEKIFEAFHQQEGQKAGKYGGTGLGLAITKRLVELMNGRISVKSQVDKGSTFKAVFNELEFSEGLPGAEHRKDITDICEHEVVFEPSVILVADDVEYNRNLVKAYLKETGIDVIESQNGDKTLKLMRKHRPALVLMDLKMPDKDGYEVTRVLKNTHVLKHTPVIAFTAHAMKADMEKISELFDGYLQKPLDRNSLISELKRFLPWQAPGKTEFTFSETGIPGTTRAELSELLDNEILPMWENICDGYYIDDIYDFARTLKQAAHEYKFDFLLNYSENLYKYARHIEIDEIEHALEEFSEVADRMRHGSSTNCYCNK